MTMTMTLAEMRQSLKTIVDANPDFEYEAPEDMPAACWYLHGGQPGCLFGHLFVAKGVPLRDIAENEERAASEVASTLGLIGSTHGTLADYMDTIQNRQDNGETWARAFQAGEDLLIDRGYVTTPDGALVRADNDVPHADDDD